MAGGDIAVAKEVEHEIVVMKIVSFDPFDDGEGQHTGLAAGEITVTGKGDSETDLRGVAKNICFDPLLDDLISVDSCHGRKCCFSFERMCFLKGWC